MSRAPSDGAGPALRALGVGAVSLSAPKHVVFLRGGGEQAGPVGKEIYSSNRNHRGPDDLEGRQEILKIHLLIYIDIDTLTREPERKQGLTVCQARPHPGRQRRGAGASLGS